MSAIPTSGATIRRSTIEREDLVGDAEECQACSNGNREVSRIDQPVDRNEWGMTPPTINAYYTPPLNSIFFPAGILQPPFFDPNADDAVNYGGIGAVIGHEIGHGFDDQGSNIDGDRRPGQLVDRRRPQGISTPAPPCWRSQYDAFEAAAGPACERQADHGREYRRPGGRSTSRCRPITSR